MFVCIYSSTKASWNISLNTVKTKRQNKLSCFNAQLNNITKTHIQCLSVLELRNTLLSQLHSSKVALIQRQFQYSYSQIFLHQYINTSILRQVETNVHIQYKRFTLHIISFHFSNKEGLYNIQQIIIRYLPCAPFRPAVE